MQNLIVLQKVKETVIASGAKQSHPFKLLNLLSILSDYFVALLLAMTD
jgi:hypothetical protein